MRYSLRILCGFLTYMCFKNITDILAYKQLSQLNDGPKLYKASNVDLIYPHSLWPAKPAAEFSTSTQREEQQHSPTTDYFANQQMSLDNNPATNPTNEINGRTEMHGAEIFPIEAKNASVNVDDSMTAATGRASSYQSSNYPFSHLIKPLMKNTAQRTKTVAKSGGIADRFTPSEAVVSHQLKTNSQNHAFSYSEPSQSTHNLYAFPPDNTNYPIAHKRPDNLKSSYSPPPSGPLNEDSDNVEIHSPVATNSDYKYPGPLSPDHLAALADSDSVIEQLDDDTGNDSSGMLGVLPASAMEESNGNGMDAMMTAVNVSENEQEYPTPPPGWLQEHPETISNPPPPQPQLSNYPSPESQDHHLIPYNHHTHHHQPLIYSHHPELTYADDYFKHGSHSPHLHYYPHYHTTTTTQAPPPEPPPEPRVKKYSYFYIGRKLWYIPLYFTVWFTFYVLWLILKSIARHKVNLPNHYVNRRSLENYDLRKTQQNRIDQLTTTIFSNLDRFQNKYLK
uniref:Uncharacterized protein n=1 Tax=Glossina morsitans morsitans TaxID=37546 RepID=A0A1B0FQ45_GLOMM